MNEYYRESSAIFLKENNFFRTAWQESQNE